MTRPSLYTGLLIEAAGSSERASAPENPGSYRTAEGINPVCGDRVKWYFRTESGRIAEIRYEAAGCLMNKASASFLARYLEGQSVDRAREMHKIISTITDPAEEYSTGDYGSTEQKPWLSLAQIRDYPARRKCVMMAWNSFIDALDRTQD